MAWYTDLFCRVSFRGKTYNEKYVFVLDLNDQRGK